MSTHTIYFHEEVRKTSALLGWRKNLILNYVYWSQENLPDCHQSRFHYAKIKCPARPALYGYGFCCLDASVSPKYWVISEGLERMGMSRLA